VCVCVCFFGALFFFTSFLAKLFSLSVCVCGVSFLWTNYVTVSHPHPHTLSQGFPHIHIVPLLGSNPIRIAASSCNERTNTDAAAKQQKEGVVQSEEEKSE